MKPLLLTLIFTVGCASTKPPLDPFLRERMVEIQDKTPLQLGHLIVCLPQKDESLKCIAWELFLRAMREEAMSPPESDDFVPNHHAPLEL